MAKIEVERLDRIRLTVFELIQKFQEPKTSEKIV